MIEKLHNILSLSRSAQALLIFVWVLSANLVWADGVSDAINAANTLGKDATTKWGGQGSSSSSNFDQLSGPVMSGSPLETLDGSVSGIAQIDCPGSEAFVKLMVQAYDNATNEITRLQYGWDSDMDGAIDKSDVYDTTETGKYIAGACINGFIACSPKGEWKQSGIDNCDFMKWAYNGTDVSLQSVTSNTLFGCFCFNSHCANPGSFQTMKQQVITALGGGIVNAVTTQKPTQRLSGGQYDANALTIDYFSAETIACTVNKAGLSNLAPYGMNNPSSLFNNVSSFQGEAASQLVYQTPDPKSYYNLITNTTLTQGVNHCQKTLNFSCSGMTTSTIERVVSGGCVDNGTSTPTVDIHVVISDIKTQSGAEPSITKDFTITPCVGKTILHRTKLNADHNPVIELGTVNAGGTTWGAWAPQCGSGLLWSYTEPILTTYPTIVGYRVQVSVNLSGAGCIPGVTIGAHPSEQFDAFYACDVNHDITINDTCTTLAADPTCKVRDESYSSVSVDANGNVTYNPITIKQNYAANGVVPVDSCMVIPRGDNLCRNWWKIDRTYTCTVDTSSYTVDFNQTHTAMATMSDLGGGSYQFTDLDGNNRVMTLGVSNEDTGECINTCEVIKISDTANVTDTNLQTAYSFKNPILDEDSGYTSELNKIHSYRECTPDASGGLTVCPYDPATETAVANVPVCGCNNSLNNAASALSVMNQLKTDQICSDGVLH